MNYQTDFDALIFDCDGTLLDTMPIHYKAWSEVLLRHGIQFPVDRFYSLGGVPAANIITLLAGEQGITVDAEAVGWEKEHYFVELVEGKIEPIEAVVSIARNTSQQLPMAVATGSPTWLAEKMLAHSGLLPLFASIIGADKIQNPKPHPEPYLTAAQALGIDPTRCCAFEDTDLGIESATAAGMTVVDVRSLAGYPGC